jgi:hypothetical protein
LGEFSSEGGEDKEEDEEALETQTHRAKRQHIAAASSQRAGTRQLNNTAFYTDPLKQRWPCERHACALAQKAEEQLCESE